MNIQFRCPQCGQTVETEEAYRGQVAECPHCGKGIVVPRKSLSQGGNSKLGIRHSPTQTPEKSAEGERPINRLEMAGSDGFHATCPHCGAEYEFDKKDIGRNTRCGICNKMFIVDAANNQHEGTAATFRVNEDGYDNPRLNDIQGYGRSPYVATGMSQTFPEWWYFAAWFASAAASTLANIIFCGMLGFILAACEMRWDLNLKICWAVGVVMSMPIGYLAFRYIAIAIVNYRRERS